MLLGRVSYKWELSRKGVASGKDFSQSLIHVLVSHHMSSDGMFEANQNKGFVRIFKI